jgi:hypothetical protein
VNIVELVITRKGKTTWATGAANAETALRRLDD